MTFISNKKVFLTANILQNANNIASCIVINLDSMLFNQNNSIIWFILFLFRNIFYSHNNMTKTLICTHRSIQYLEWIKTEHHNHLMIQSRLSSINQWINWKAFSSRTQSMSASVHGDLDSCDKGGAVGRQEGYGVSHFFHLPRAA